MTIASTLFTSNLSEPSEAKGPRAGLLTLPINSSKVSFTTYFWMLPPMPKLKCWLKGSQGVETFVTQPSRRLPDRRHLSWKQCPALLQCLADDGLPDIGETWKLHSPAPFQWVSLCHKCGQKSQQNIHRWICSWYLLKFMWDLHWCPNDVPKTFNFCLSPRF